MTHPDLRILALADAKLLPPETQAAFDHWRIWKARDAVAAAVRKRIGLMPTLTAYLERLEAADAEETIFQNMHALIESVEVYRAQTGLHGDYLTLIMSNHLNPWGVVDFQRDFDHPSPAAVAAAEKLWALCREAGVDVPALLLKLNSKDSLLAILDEHYLVHPPS